MKKSLRFLLTAAFALVGMSSWAQQKVTLDELATGWYQLEYTVGGWVQDAQGSKLQTLEIANGVLHNGDYYDVVTATDAEALNTLFYVEATGETGTNKDGAATKLYTIKLATGNKLGKGASRTGWDSNKLGLDAPDEDDQTRIRVHNSNGNNYWDLFAKNGYTVLGAGANQSMCRFTFYDASAMAAAYDVYTVVYGDDVAGTPKVTYNKAGYAGIKTVINGGVYFIAKGQTPAAADFTCEAVNGVPATLAVNASAKTITVGVNAEADATLYVKASTAEAPVWYTIASYNRGGVLTANEDGSISHVAATDNSYWWFELANAKTGALIAHNYNGKVISSAWKMGDEGMNVFVLPNGVNDYGFVISRNATNLARNCIDANNYNTGVGTWGPSASDWQGTTWVFTEAAATPDVMAAIATLRITYNTLNCVGGYRATAEQVAALGAALDAYDLAAANAVIAQLDEQVDLSNNKMYVLNCERGNLVAKGIEYTSGETTETLDALCCTAKFGIEHNNADPAQQWALISFNEKLYLYSVGTQKFLGTAGCKLTAEAPADNIGIEEGSDAVYSWILRVGNSYVNAGNASSTYLEGLIINSWGGAGKWDGGNQFRIVEVGDFNPAEAIAAIIAVDAQADMNRLEALQADLTQFIAGKEIYILADVRQAIETILGDSWAMAIQGAYEDAVENNAAYVSPDIWTILETQIAWVKEQIEGVQNGTIALYTATGVVGDGTGNKAMPFFNTEVGVEVYADHVVLKGWDGTEGSDLKVAYHTISQGIDGDELMLITGIEQTVDGEVVSELVEDDDDPDLNFVSLQPQSDIYPAANIIIANEMTGIKLGEGDEDGMGTISLSGLWLKVAAASSEGDVDPGFGGPAGEEVELTYMVSWPGVQVPAQVGEVIVTPDPEGEPVYELSEVTLVFRDWTVAAAGMGSPVLRDAEGEVVANGETLSEDEELPHILTVVLDEAVTAPGQYTLEVPVSLYDANTGAALNTTLTYIFTVAAAPVVGEFTADPAVGSTVNGLQTIAVTFNDWTTAYGMGATLVDAEGNTVAEGESNVGEEANTVVVTLGDEPFAVSGEYTLLLPVYLMNEDGTMLNTTVELAYTIEADGPVYVAEAAETAFNIEYDDAGYKNLGKGKAASRIEVYSDYAVVYNFLGVEGCDLKLGLFYDEDENEAYTYLLDGANSDVDLFDEGDDNNGVGGQPVTVGDQTLHYNGGMLYSAATGGQLTLQFEEGYAIYVWGDIATAISNAKSASNAAAYNLNGQRVSNTQKGLYIINGKKVVVK